MGSITQQANENEADPKPKTKMKKRRWKPAPLKIRPAHFTRKAFLEITPRATQAALRTLEAAEKRHDDNDHQQQPHDSTRGVPPGSAVSPRGKHPDQRQHEQNDQYCS
jgi:hypothetical protein